MPLNVGPYDGRKARRKRCDACVKRKIKPTIFTPVFVGETPNINAKIRTSASPLAGRTTFPLLQSACPKRFDRDLPYFFTSFLPMNVLTSDSVPIGMDLLAMGKTSPALRDAIHAVAALHRKQQGQFTIAGGNGNYETSEALQAYNRSVRCVQNHIASNTFLGDPSALWTTFLLGLFELMRDSTGTNWLSHFLHGTCTILRLQHPEILACPGVHNLQKRTFFLATRIFEIARSLIYSSPTFLSEWEWTAALAELWEGEGVALWHPKEALFDILPSFSDLSIRTLHFCENAAQLSTDTQCALAQSLADEGLVLQKSLQQWWVETAIWEQTFRNRGIRTTMPSKPDTELLVGYVYYHAISIYLSGTYDYHMHWSWPDTPCAPILPRSKIDWHVLEILRVSHELLAQGAAGVLLFFPLRVAGARAVDGRSRNDILNLLHTTGRRGFIVAEAFTTDLSNLWASESMLL
ncbi:hypothetical protein K469DRAFT_732098 [Zopfia rhizophila CBS 207.26]|uniref:Uncharacterized protein n=1 Tax=Zopfia rhizophila CBS 207.26 TaxID=1314779 RepID=A0A6A6DHY7_9PEZI|nr:hypothetical protein K469DRAFT_732098 [Zopfia rhizophila CBS 207.26]